MGLLDPPGWVLTVGAAVEAQAQPDLPTWVPGHWDDADVACKDGVVQVVPHHPALVHVPKERLGMKSHCQHLSPGPGSLLPPEDPLPQGLLGTPPTQLLPCWKKGFQLVGWSP